MPTLSASDYTQYLKFKVAAASPIRPAIQTRDNATLSRSVLNANVLASQAAFVTTPATTSVVTPSATVTTAGTNLLVSVVDAGSSGYRYTSSLPHGLVAGQTVTITGFTGTLTPSPNVTKTVSVVEDDTHFILTGFTLPIGSATGTGSITGRVYYVTSDAHGMVVGDIATVTNVTTFSASRALVIAVPSATTFVLSSATTGSSASGQSGSLSYPRSFNQFMALRNNARVQALPDVQTRSTDKAKSTLSWTSGTSGSVGSTSSSKFQQPGGQPAKGRVGTYTRLPQNAGWIQGGAEMRSSGQKRF